jgi:ferredoxin
MKGSKGEWIEMPWIESDGCVGCGICVRTCPTGAISMVGGKAVIDMSECIRCGRCHSACPQGAVMHDSERIPDEVKSNVVKTKEFMEACARYFDNPEKEKQACLNRMIKHFTKGKTVAEETLGELEKLKK